MTSNLSTQLFNIIRENAMTNSLTTSSQPLVAHLPSYPLDKKLAIQTEEYHRTKQELVLNGSFQTKQTPFWFLKTSATYFLGALGLSLGQLIGAESALATAATLNFDQGITDGVNPILKLVLTHNGKAIFLSSAIGMLLGGGNSDGWTRLKMGGLWAVGAAALIHVMKGTLGVAMPG